MRHSQDQNLDEAYKAALSAISILPNPEAQMKVISGLAVWVTINATQDVFANPNDQPELPFSGAFDDLSNQLPGIFAERGVTTKANRILVTAALLQKRNGNRAQIARTIRETLERAGYEVGNIAAQLNGIVKRHGRKQMTKTTKRNQPRQYWVTATGMRTVALMLHEPEDRSSRYF